MFVVPGRCDVRPRCRSLGVFQKWACVNVVVDVVGHSARNYGGGGVQYVVGGPCWSPPISVSLVSLVPVHEDVFGMLRNIGRATLLPRRVNESLP